MTKKVNTETKTVEAGDYKCAEWLKERVCNAYEYPCIEESTQTVTGCIDYKDVQKKKCKQYENINGKRECQEYELVTEEKCAEYGNVQKEVCLQRDTQKQCTDWEIKNPVCTKLEERNTSLDDTNDMMSYLITYANEYSTSQTKVGFYILTFCFIIWLLF